MTKKILPTMIGAALAGGMTVAQADVTVFGHIDTAILNWDESLSYAGFEGGVLEYSGASGYDDLNLVCTTCSIGFKGSEDLGNGLKVMFKLDFQYDTTVRNDGDGSSGDGDNNNSGLVDRDQWLGLGGNFGKVRVGTISTGYKSHGAMIDPLYRTVIQARGVGLQSELHSGAGEEGQGRAVSTFRWDSPDWNGLKLVAHYTLDTDEGDGEDNNPFGIGGSYENGGILVFADYLTNDGDGYDTQREITAWKLGGQYSMNNFTVFAQYENIEDNYTDVDDFAEDWFGSDLDFSDYSADGELDKWHIGGTMTMGNNTLYAAYGQTDGDFHYPGDSSYMNGTVESSAFTIAAIHAMSKRTKVYVGYTNFESEGSERHDYNPDWVFKGDYEADAFTLGMKHKF